MTGALSLFGRFEKLEWSVALEILCMLGVSITLLIASIVCGRAANHARSQSKTVLDRAALDAVYAGREDKEECVEVAEVSCKNLENVEPVKIIFLEVSLEVVGMMYTALGYLGQFVVTELRDQLGDRAAWLVLPKMR